MAHKKATGPTGPTETVYKCTRPCGSDFRTGTLNYAAALEASIAVEVLDAAPASGGVCGHGIHVSPTAKQTIRFADGSCRPWRFFQGVVPVADIIERNANKLRVRRFYPQRELTLADIFGADLANRVESVCSDMESWKTIPWLKPKKPLKESAVVELVGQWRAAIQPWLPAGVTLPDKVKIVTTAAAAAADADAAADAAAADAAADAAAAAADAAAAAAAAADADYADYVDADYVDADYADAAAADAADAAAMRRLLGWWWYTRPYCVLRRDAWWKIAGMDKPNPSAPLIKLYQMGCLPIGYVGNEFGVYCPPVA